MKKLTKTEVAKKLGVSRPTIYSLIKKGVITPDENGLIALDGESEFLHDVKIQEYLHDVRNIIENSGHIKAKFKDKYIAQLEQTIQHLEAELGKVQSELSLTRKQLSRYQNSRRHLIRESAQLSQDSIPAAPAERRTSNNSNKINALLEKHVGLLEQEIGRLQVENQALRAAVGKSTPDEYMVTKYLGEVYKPYDPYDSNSPDRDDYMEREFGKATWYNKPTEERLPLS